MPSLREPDEARNRRFKKEEPMSWQVRRSQGLSNEPEVRRELTKANLKELAKEKEKEEARQLKLQMHEERQRVAEQRAWNAARSKEEETWRKWSEDLRKRQENENLQQFQNFLIQNYAIQDDKGRTVLPLEIQKRAAGYVQMAKTDGAGAIKKFKEDYIEEGNVRQQYQQLLPQIIKDREKALGKALDPKEIEQLSQLSPADMKQVVAGWQQKQAAMKAQQQAELDKASQELEKPMSRQELLGGKQRYTGEQLRSGLPVREDLSFNEAAAAYDDLIDRAVSAAGGGVLANAAGAYLKYMPGARDLIDPNTPIRYGLRKVGEFVKGPLADAARGTWENIKRGEVHPTGVDVAPGGGVEEGLERGVADLTEKVGRGLAGATRYALEAPHPTGVDVEPGGEGIGRLPQPVEAGLRTAAQAAGRGFQAAAPLQHPTGIDVLPTAEPPPREPVTPIPPAAPPPAPTKAPEEATTPQAFPATPKPSPFAGLTELVKGLFVDFPEEFRNRQNIWKSLSQEARQPDFAPSASPYFRGGSDADELVRINRLGEAPVTPQHPADSYRKLEPPDADELVRINRAIN